jgi:hypothetical protein
LIAAFAAVGALYFSNSTLSASNDQLGLSRQTAQSELFKSAAEQLDSDKESVRLSGVYLLQRLAQDSVPDQHTVRRLLEAFVRTETSTSICNLPEREAPVDIQAALDIIVKYSALPDPTPNMNLSGSCLTRAILDEANIAGAYMDEVNLSGAGLARTNFTSVFLFEASFTKAHLLEANFTEAMSFEANFTEAHLEGANFTGAGLTGANFTSAYLARAYFTGADLTGADLTSADLADTNLTGIFHDAGTRWPRGFIPPLSA